MNERANIGSKVAIDTMVTLYEDISFWDLPYEKVVYKQQLRVLILVGCIDQTNPRASDLQLVHFSSHDLKFELLKNK